MADKPAPLPVDERAKRGILNGALIGLFCWLVIWYLLS